MTDQLPLANLITLGASDFGALRDFYRGVGWPQVMDDVHNRRHRNGPPLFLRPLAHSDPAIGPLTFHFSAGGHSFDDLAATVDAAPLAPRHRKPSSCGHQPLGLTSRHGLRRSQ